MSKKIVFSILILLTIAGAFYFPLLKYAAYQGFGQLKLIMDSEKIESILTDTKLDKNIKRKLRLVAEVKIFATQQLGLKATKNFNTVYIPKKDTIRLWVINASYPLQLKNYIWHYPIIGDAPYKGFFNTQLLKKELQELRKESLDIDVGNVQAWSTLGWFNDPLMGSMLQEPDEELIATIIHEMFHATVFVKGEAELNENLAEFVGIEGAKLFLANKPMHNRNYFERVSNQNKQFNLFMHQCAIQLQQLYASKLPDKQKYIEKKKLLFTFCVELFKKNLFSVEKNRLICKRILHAKNAFFTAFLTYNAKDTRFENELQSRFTNNIQLFINYYKSRYQS